MDILPRDERQERWLYFLLLVLATVIPAAFIRVVGPIVATVLAMCWAGLILYDMRQAIVESEAEETQALLEEENPVANKVNEFINFPARRMNEVLDRLEAAEKKLGIEKKEAPVQPKEQLSTLRRQGRP